MKKRHLLQFLVAILVIAIVIIQCTKDSSANPEEEENIEASELTISSPTNNQIFYYDDDILIEGTMNIESGNITNIEFYTNDGKHTEIIPSSATEYTYTIEDHKFEVGLEHTIKVKATDTEGRVREVSVNIEVANIFTEINAGTFNEVENTSIALGDIDNDNDLDLILTGVAESGDAISKIYTNDGFGSFTEINPGSLFGVASSSLALGDIDNDDDLDLILTGWGSDNGVTSKIYKNDGFGLFTEINPGSLTGVYRSSIALEDIDNDDDLDLILTGRNSSDEGISKIYSNDGAGDFTEINAGTLTGVQESSLALGDIDNDDDLDLILTGWDSSFNPTSIIYKNDGSGSFTEINADTLIGVEDGSIALGDIDNDDDLDLILTGEYIRDGETSEIYKNDGSGSFTEINAGALTGVNESSIALGDIDNDNDLDLILTGYGSSSYISHIYKNDGSGSFTEINPGSLPGVVDSSVALGDIDNDGDLDLILIGYGDVAVSKIYRNNAIH